MEMSEVTLLNTIYRRNIKSVGTLRHAYTFYYLLLSMTHFRKMVYYLRTNATQSLSTVTGTVQKIYSVDGLKQTLRRWNDWTNDNLTKNITTTEYFFPCMVCFSGVENKNRGIITIIQKYEINKSDLRKSLIPF